MTSYKITSAIEAEIEKLDESMLVTIKYDNNTFTFSERALNFLSTLNVEYSRSARALLKVGEAVGLITAEQVADYRVRRAEYEQALSGASVAVVEGEIEEIKTETYNSESDSMETVTTYRVTVNGKTDVRYFIDRADAEKLLSASLAAGKLM